MRPSLYIEIVVEDNRGNELSFFLETWKSLMKQQYTIEEYFHHTDKNILHFLCIEPLIVQCMKYNNSNCVCLELTNVWLILMVSKLNSMFNLAYCIEYMFIWLIHLTWFDLIFIVSLELQSSYTYVLPLPNQFLLHSILTYTLTYLLT